MLKKLISIAAAAAMMLSAVMTASAEEQTAYEAERVSVIGAEDYSRVMLEVSAGSSGGLVTTQNAYEAGIAAAQDSSDLLLDCGSRAGYDYLGKMRNGAKLQKLYDGMYNSAVALWKDTSTTLESPADLDEFVIYGVIPGQGLTFNEMAITYFTFRNDHPIFYYSGVVAGSDGVDYIMLADVAYKYGSVRASAQSKIKQYITKTANKTRGLSTDFAKARAIHDAVNGDIEYAFDRNGNPSMEVWAHNIMGAVEKGKGVCETYARTYQLMMNYLDIDNYLVTGKAGGDHAWNMIRLDDGKYYYVDCTWDDSLGDYSYFAKGSNVMNKDHTPDKPTTTDPQRFLIALPTAAAKDFDPNNYVPKPKYEPGDVNHDLRVDVMDITLIAAHIKELAPLSREMQANADVDGNGKIDVGDITRIAARIKGLI